MIFFKLYHSAISGFTRATSYTNANRTLAYSVARDATDSLHNKYDRIFIYEHQLKRNGRLPCFYILSRALLLLPFNAEECINGQQVRDRIRIQDISKVSINIMT
jgi:hypothetical protein